MIYTELFYYLALLFFLKKKFLVNQKEIDVHCKQLPHKKDLSVNPKENLAYTVVIFQIILVQYHLYHVIIVIDVNIFSKCL